MKKMEILHIGIIYAIIFPERNNVTVEFYRTETGIKPAGEFIKSIENIKLRAKVVRSIGLLETYGENLREPDSSPLGGGIFELRTIHGDNIARCLYFFFCGDKAIITNGFIKKTRKTPPGEIELARKYKADYERRNTK